MARGLPRREVPLRAGENHQHFFDLLLTAVPEKHRDMELRLNEFLRWVERGKVRRGHIAASHGLTRAETHGRRPARQRWHGRCYDRSRYGHC